MLRRWMGKMCALAEFRDGSGWQALRDLADPAEGVYNATALLETRLSYVKMMLDKYQKLPSSRPGVASPTSTLTVTAPSEEVSGSTLLNSVVSAIQDGIKDLAPGSELEGVESPVEESSRKVTCQLAAAPHCRAHLSLRRSAPTSPISLWQQASPLFPPPVLSTSLFWLWLTLLLSSTCSVSAGKASHVASMQETSCPCNLLHYSEQVP